MANNGVDAPAPDLDPSRDRFHATMGTTFSAYDTTTAPARATPTRSLDDLHEELLATITRFLAPRDVEALTVASKIVAREVLPRFPIWKELFCYRWNMWNYALEKDADRDAVALEIDERLRALVPSGVSESRLYQLLAHAVTPVPSFADVRQTERGRYFSHMDHAVEAVGDPIRRRTLDIAYTGRMLGGDRCVRANAPFVPTFRVAVYAIANEHKRKIYRVGLATSAYYEISIRANPNRRGRMGQLQQLWRHIDSDVTAIGLGTASFPLIDKQPGWDSQSIGYHGDDGHFFHRNNRGRRFSKPFGTGDTVGCGLHRDLQSGRSFVYFTNNGEVVRHGDMGFECEHASWYPVVGLDSHDIIHFNFGQEPFVCTGAVDALFEECTGQYDILTSHLSWYNISESDAESSEGESTSDSDDSMSDHGSQDSDFEMGYDRLSDMSELVMYMNQFLDEHGDGDADEDQVEEQVDSQADEEM